MGHRCDPCLAVLHALKLKGFADPDTVAEMTGLSGEASRHHLAAAGELGLARHRAGRVTGWSLTPEGRSEEAARLAEELARVGAGDVLAAMYPAFSEVDGRFQRVCTDWQLRLVGADQVPNNHEDPTYDAGVILALGRVDDEVQPMCATVGAVLARMARYGPRLTAARARIEAGDSEGFTRPLANSYRDVWMELHEDLQSSRQPTGSSAAG